MADVTRMARDSGWAAKATRHAISRVRQVINERAAVSSPNMGVGFLSDSELGWLVCAAIVGWCEVRAQQAVALGLDKETSLHTETFLHTDPARSWDAGAISTVLKRLPKLVDVDLAKPIQSWSKDEMIGFLLAAYDLMTASMRARDRGAASGGLQPNANVMVREMNAAAGNPLMDPDELSEPI